MLEPREIDEINGIVNFVNYQSRIIGMMWVRIMGDEPLPSFQQYLKEEEERKERIRKQEVEIMRQLFHDSQADIQETGSTTHV